MSEGMETSEYLGEPLKLAEFDCLDLPAETEEHLSHLLDAEAAGTLAPMDAAQLILFKEAVFYQHLSASAT